MRFYAVAELAAAYIKTPILAAQDYMLVLSAIRARYTGEPFWGIREKPAFDKIDQRFELSVETQLVDALLKFAKAITTCSTLKPSLFEVVDRQGLKRLAYGVLLAEQSPNNPTPPAETLGSLEKNCEDFTATVLRELTLAEISEPALADPASYDRETSNPEVPEILDGPDESRMMLVYEGHEFGPFTPTQFDIVQLMWKNRESAWSESNAFFLFHQTSGWSQADGGPFGKHQTDIQSVFEEKGFGLPWRRARGSFVWRGLVPPKAKRSTKAKVSRSKKR
jgi:hypothetical protein